MSKATTLVNNRTGNMAQMIDLTVARTSLFKPYTYTYTLFDSNNQLTFDEYLSCDLAVSLIFPFNLTRFPTASSNHTFLSAKNSMTGTDLLSDNAKSLPHNKPH